MLNQLIWLKLKPETRANLAVMLGLHKSGGSEVVAGVQVSDGYTPQDLLGITVEKLQTVLNSKETDFYKLFDELVKRVELPVEEVKPIEVEEVELQEMPKEPKKKGTK